MSSVALHVRPSKCAACNRPLEIPLFCDACHTLAPADQLSYFEMLGLAPAYDLDAGLLRQRFLQLARAVHPDRFQGADADALQLSLRNSARLNQAFNVLSDSIRRAEYLLEWHGGRSSAQDKRVPQEVLTRSLMLREEFEEATASGNARRPSELKAECLATRDARLARVAELARALPGDEPLRDALRLELNAIRYDAKFLEQV